ncbi:MAG: bifunctional demethylmenaquinone methyltransferase/2-methoxy-6-polyprenyl-1,4-benzoquinol methylase UbiE [Synechococcales cyanobacterium RM1_1_8]|nr:bifunctional demethylmenaquinone methyltransferase/2-methoxy-6-polyprenyl-1,4-benzoquinol methylase UbiE [Synechococcales cyanobacterium RM1_1_8]
MSLSHPGSPEPERLEPKSPEPERLKPGLLFPQPAPPRPEQVQALFNRIAPVYDQLNDQLSFGLHRVWKRMAVSWVGLQPGQVALDLCCGTGDLALLLAQQVGAQGQVYGLDFAWELLAVAEQRAERDRPRPAILWQQGDALNLAFEDQFFDGATLGYGLRNVGDIPRCLAELYRVLKPGARATILDMNRPISDFSGVLRQFQSWYLDNLVLPNATRLGVREEYAYINPSIERFPLGPEQVKLAQAAGFRQATYYPLALGLMGALVLER